MTLSKVTRTASNLLFGLLVTVLVLLFIEGSARLIPASITGDLSRPVPALAPADRAAELYSRRGFRGRRPCQDCPQNNIRIVTIGGSSTYGVPMYYGTKTYSAFLQRLLDKKRPHEKYEVLNAGIAGFGIWQIVEALENHIVSLKPHIVMICAWFNDSSKIPGWYGYHDLSDQEAYLKVRRLRRLESFSLYQLIQQSQAYTLAYNLASEKESAISAQRNHSQKRGKLATKKRSTPKEFEAGLNRVLDLSERHNFLPIFVFEALNRTESREKSVSKNKYYQAIERLAAERDIPIVDSLTPLANRMNEWLFYDFIHPNEHGHEIIAETIAEALFSGPWHTGRSREFFSTLGITLSEESAP